MKKAVILEPYVRFRQDGSYGRGTLPEEMVALTMQLTIGARVGRQ